MESRAVPMVDLVEVCFLPAERTAWVRSGMTLVEAGAAAGVEIVTGCTRGMCGTDPVRVLGGADGLEPPAAHERATLERMGLGTDFRLACSARVTRGRVEIETDAF